MPTHFVLIDYENVQPDGLAALDRPDFKVILFAGASQAKVPLGLAAALQPMGSRAEYIKIASNGRNALDFHIAFYIGHLAAAHPDACFHIISRDKGFDPLIEHLKGKSIRAVRTSDVAGMAVEAAPPLSREDKVKLVLANLQKLNGGRPGTVKKLSNTIASIFQKQIEPDEIEAILQALQGTGKVRVADKKVTYLLP